MGDDALTWKTLDNLYVQGDVQQEDSVFTFSAISGSPPRAFILQRDFVNDFEVCFEGRYLGKLENACGYGLWFRVTSMHGLVHPWGFGYALQYDLGVRGLRLCKYPNSVDFAPTYTTPLDNDWHHWRVKAEGEQILVFFDDQIIYDVKDWTFRFGSLGFGVWNGAVAQIRNVSTF